jgi:hypothetical protein
VVVFLPRLFIMLHSLDLETLGDPIDDAAYTTTAAAHLWASDEGRLTACSVSTSTTVERHHAAGSRRTASDYPQEHLISNINIDRLYDVSTPPNELPPQQNSSSQHPLPQEYEPVRPQNRNANVQRRSGSTGGHDNDDVASLQLAHRLALQRIFELEQQLHERSEQLLVQQSKVESSKDKIQVLSSAVQSLKKKIEANTRRSNGLASSSPSTASHRPSALVTVSCQTNDDWRRDHEASNAALHDLCAVQEQEASKWRASATAARQHASELVLDVKALTQKLTAVTSNQNSVRAWGRSLVYRCLAEEHADDRDVLQNRWAAMSLDEATAFVETCSETRNESVVRVVAALVGPSGVQPVAAAHAPEGDASPYMVLPPPASERTVVSPSGLSTVDGTASPKVPSPLISPSVRRGGEARSLLEELARASIATAASAAVAPVLPSAQARDIFVGATDNHLVNVRAIEMRLEGLRKALFASSSSAGGGGPSSQLPLALRAGIEAEIAQLQKTLEHMATESALAVRITSRRQQNVAAFSRGASSPPQTMSVPRLGPHAAVHPDRFHPTHDTSSFTSLHQRSRLHDDVIELSPAAKDPSSSNSMAFASTADPHHSVFRMRSSSEDYAA